MAKELAATTSKIKPKPIVPFSGKKGQKQGSAKKVELTPKQKEHQQKYLKMVTEALKRRFNKK